VAPEDDDDVVPDDDEADDADVELDFELPHALTTAAIRNRQAAMAASLLKRMASLILGSPRSCRFSRATVGQNATSDGGSAGGC